MTVRAWLQSASERLQAAGVEAHALEAQVLLAESLGMDRPWVLAHPEVEIGSGLADRWLERRVGREPLAYIVGWREFYGRRFAVGPGVLVPRQETETLIDAALELEEVRDVLDLCTGSGCIAITLQLERPDWKVVGSDVSDVALRFAERNARALGADVRFVASNGFESLGEAKFELVVSNPPYIAEGADLMPEVGVYEPREALFAGADGLDFYRRIASEANAHLRPGGRVLLEIGQTQAREVRTVFEESGWRCLGSTLDLSGAERVLAFGARQV